MPAAPRTRPGPPRPRRRDPVLALAWAAKAASGGNVRFSARRFSIAADWDEVASALTDTPHGLSLARPSYRAVPGTDGCGSAGLIRPGVSISLASSAAIRRLRYSPAAAHWSEARTEPRIFRVTPCSLIASTRSTRGGSRMLLPPGGVGLHRLADIVDDLDRTIDVRAVGDRHVLVDPRPDARQVRGHLDLPIRDRMDDTIDVADASCAAG